MNAQVIRASAAGVAATAVDVGVLVLQVRHGVPVAPAAFLSATAGAVTSYALNKYVAFQDRSRVSPRQLARFASVAVASALLMAIMMQITAVGLHVPYVLAKLICAVVVFALWTYPAQHKVFRKSSSLSSSSSVAHSH